MIPSTLTLEEEALIGTALNQYWHETYNKIHRPGVFEDIEIKELKDHLEKIKQLMIKMSFI